MKSSRDSKLVPTTGLEPVRCYSLEPESSASANSATWAMFIYEHSRRFILSPILLCIPALQLVNPNTSTKPGHKPMEHLFHDGRWRSSPKVPNLLQYVSNGNYYGRIKVGGKTIRERVGLITKVADTAKRITLAPKACPACERKRTVRLRIGLDA